jgi:hypothetical protein
MQIVVQVSGFTDWVPVKDQKFTPSDEDLLALKFKQSADGKWLAKTLIDTPSETAVSLPPQEIQDCFEHFERVGTPKSRDHVVAWYLEEKVMPHNAPPECWVSIQVEGEPDLQTFLANRFGLKEGK